MKEYLVKAGEEYVVINNPHPLGIEIPEGADYFAGDKMFGEVCIYFYKDNSLDSSCGAVFIDKKWQRCQFNKDKQNILWQRNKEQKMKEWLLKTEEGKYYFHRDDMDFCPKYIEKIEIPEGATSLLYSESNNKLKHFTNNKNKLMALYDIEDGCRHWYGDAADYMHMSNVDILWQRKEKSVVDAEVFEDEKKKTIDDTLNERQSQYGCFEDVAFATENIIGILKRCGYDNMPNTHKMAMYMIVSKMARLVNGDHNHLDSWHDIGGYSKLIENLIGGENE